MNQEMDLVIQMDVSAMQPAGNLIPPEIAINVVEKAASRIFWYIVATCNNMIRNQIQQTI